MNKKDFEDILKYPIYKNEIEKSDKAIASKSAQESTALTKKVENNMFLKQDNNQNGKNKRKFNGSFAPAKIPRGNNSATPENQSNRQNIIKQRNSLPIASAKTK